LDEREILKYREKNPLQISECVHLRVCVCVCVCVEKERDREHHTAIQLFTNT